MNSFLNKKIPTILGLFLLCIAVLTTSYLVNTGVILFGGAAPSDNPQDVRITNVSDSAFTVTYKTEAQVIGTIALKNDTNTQTILDERDQQSGVPQLHTLHSMTVHNIQPAHLYEFSITSGTTTYQNNGVLFSAKTAPILSASPSATTPFTGKVLDANGNAPKEALLFLTTSNGQSLSTLVKQSGIYIIPLNTILSSNFSERLSLTQESVMQALVTDGKSSSQVQVPLSGASPVPLITLGSNYNFISSTTPIASTAASLGFPPFPSSNLQATPVIITPKKDEGFTDSQPQFRGTALPNQPVSIEIHSDSVVTGTTATDAFGNWTFRPTTPLSVGQHTLSITTKNASGILTTIQQSFTVFASGSQVNQSATPSGQLSPTVSPTLAPQKSPTPTISTGSASPFPKPTVKPTVGLPTPKPTLPPTGNNSLVISSALGLVTTLIGVVLFVITKGAL